VGVVGKPANDERTKVQADREVAARILAVELGLDSLVPVTVLRNMPPQADVDGETVGSAQVLWPGFKTALEAKLKASQCPGGEATSWPIALFDWLASNSDRHLANWGVIKMFDGSFRVVLIDHGHAFGGGGHGEFAEHHQGQELPPALLAQVEAFVSGQDQSRLYGVLSDEDVAHVYERASAVATEKQLILR
jgi:hypothetical protein